MNSKAVILVGESEDEHFSVIEKELHRAGLYNRIVRLGDNQAIFDFLFMTGDSASRSVHKQYLLILDVHMPQINGVEVLKKLKNDGELKKIPVLILTGSDDPAMVEHCHKLGCSMYIVKPEEKDECSETRKKTGLFLSSIEVPEINGAR